MFARAGGGLQHVCGVSMSHTGLGPLFGLGWHLGGPNLGFVNERLVAYRFEQCIHSGRATPQLKVQWLLPNSVEGVF